MKIRMCTGTKLNPETTIVRGHSGIKIFIWNKTSKTYQSCFEFNTKVTSE